MGEAQCADGVLGEFQVELMVVVEVRKLPAPVEKSYTTGDRRRLDCESFDRDERLKQFLLEHVHGGMTFTGARRASKIQAVADFGLWIKAKHPQVGAVDRIGDLDRQDKAQIPPSN